MTAAGREVKISHEAIISQKKKFDQKMIEDLEASGDTSCKTSIKRSHERLVSGAGDTASGHETPLMGSVKRLKESADPLNTSVDSGVTTGDGFLDSEDCSKKSDVHEEHDYGPLSPSPSPPFTPQDDQTNRATGVKADAEEDFFDDDDDFLKTFDFDSVVKIKTIGDADGRSHYFKSTTPGGDQKDQVVADN